MAKPWVIGLVAFLSGGVAASGAWSAFPPKAPLPAKAEPVEKDAKDDDLLKANANLTASLHECDRRLAELGERPVGVQPAPTASATASAGESERRRGPRERREMTKEDWERMAESGVVPVRIPCIRDTPWTPSERAVDRLGLAPSDVDVLKDAYAASNKRMQEAIRPLCAQALGSPEAAEKVGASQCIDVINNTARKTNADDTKAALSRVAEVQAGKREAPKAGASTPAVEQLGLLLATEQKTFENDLAQKLGPEEAHRLANAPELCAERRMLRAGEIDPSMFGGRQRGGGR
ncbi:MAG: hypothetical protein KIT84_31965 [Labilithrix sp.]|nr:hypothetical protein [Labilithrix sp.]MCW5815688.1 hypothetical protein [Labilithrix sp.]